MADPSGTVATTTVEVADVLDSAAARCGIQPAQMTPEIVAALRRNLYLILSRLANRGAALWTVERVLLPLRTDQTSYTLWPGTLAVLNASYRAPTRLAYTGNPTATLTAGAAAVAYVGLLPSATGTATLVFEVSDDGLAWTAVSAPGATALTAGAWLWYSVDPAPAAAQFRVRATAGSFSLADLHLSNAGQEIPMYQLNRDDYAALPDKRVSGQPLQFLFDRRDPPVMHLWPMPATAEAHVIYWRQRQPQDVGDLTHRLDLPARWLDAVIYKLAAQSIMELPGADLARQATLLQLATAYEQEAADDETDHGPRRMHPAIRGYTR